LISEREAQAERFLESWLPSYRKKGELDKPMFVQLARWKSTRQTPRYEANSEEQVRTQTRIAFEAKEDDRALASLMELSGVGMRTATALLHWMRPESFPILDFRVVNALGEPQPANWENLAEYGRLAKRLRGLAGDLGVDMRTLDRALWAWDKRRS
jgi:thermostable 8-oxoguanine DNA glycosylase